MKILKSALIGGWQVANLVHTVPENAVDFALVAAFQDPEDSVELDYLKQQHTKISTARGMAQEFTSGLMDGGFKSALKATAAAGIGTVPGLLLSPPSPQLDQALGSLAAQIERHQERPVLKVGAGLATGAGFGFLQGREKGAGQVEGFLQGVEESQALLNQRSVVKSPLVLLSAPSGIAQGVAQASSKNWTSKQAVRVAGVTGFAIGVAGAAVLGPVAGLAICSAASLGSVLSTRGLTESVADALGPKQEPPSSIRESHRRLTRNVMLGAVASVARPKTQP